MSLVRMRASSSDRLCANATTPTTTHTCASSAGWCVQRQEQSLALLMPAFDEEVRALAGQISESRLRVGIPDQDVFGGSGFSMRKLQLQIRDASVSVRDGVDFFVLGVRMLVTDVGYSGRLFGRATIGVTLKSREVSV